MHKFLSIMLLLTLLAVAAVAQTAPQADAKAQEILKQARQALGGESKLKSLQSLTANGSVSRTFGQNSMGGELEVNLVVPDKILISSGMQTPMGDITTIQAYNNGQLWFDSIRPVGMGGGGGMFVMRGGPGGGGNPSPEERAANEARQKAEFARLTLGWLLMTPASFPVQYSYAGEAVAPDGKADVIDVKGEQSFAVRLFFDQTSHQLLMLSYKGKDFRQMMQFRGGPGGPGGGQGRPPGMMSREELEKLPPEERKKKEEEMRAAVEKMQAERRERMAKAPDVDFTWNFSDYKSVNGINLPHRLTKTIGGDPTEEWEVNKFKVNPQIKPDKFEKKEKAQGTN